MNIATLVHARGLSEEILVIRVARAEEGTEGGVWKDGEYMFARIGGI